MSTLSRLGSFFFALLFLISSSLSLPSHVERTFEVSSNRFSATISDPSLGLDLAKASPSHLFSSNAEPFSNVYPKALASKVCKLESAQVTHSLALRWIGSAFSQSLPGYISSNTSIERIEEKFIAFRINLTRKQPLMAPQSQTSLGFDPPLV